MDEVQQLRPPSLSTMIIGSVDTLCGTSVDQEIPPEWNYDPPVLLKVPPPLRGPRMMLAAVVGRGGQQQQQQQQQTRAPTPEEYERLLKGMIRLGIPPVLRCAVWLSNIIQTIHPEEPQSYWFEYRTLAKVRVLDGAYEHVLQQIIPSYKNNNENSKDNNTTTSSASTTNPQESVDTNTKSHELPISSSFDTVELATNRSASSSNNGNLYVDHDPKQQVDSNNNNNNNSTEWDGIEVWKFGRNDGGIYIDGTIPSGEIAQKRVLVALERILNISYAPIIPTLVTILLSCMSESYVFCSIREMSHEVSINGYFPITHREYKAWCYTFGDILRKLHPTTAQYLFDRGVLDIENLKPIFQDCFVSILPFPYVQRIIDIYTLEGSKVLFRFGISLLVLYKIESAETLVTISNADEWWHTMKIWAYSKRFHFDVVVKKAYGVHGHGIRRQLNFPRRSIIQRIIRLEEESIRREEMENNDTYIDDEDENNIASIQPLGLIQKQRQQQQGDENYFGDSSNKEDVVPILLQSSTSRLLLSKWVPITLRLSNLHLLYSTNYHGRTLERFYSHVKNARHTILVCEVLSDHYKNQGNDETTTTATTPVVIGMYASQAWRVSTKVYGDGGVFLFRLQPNEKCWKWQPWTSTSTGTTATTITSSTGTSTSIRKGSGIIDQVDFDDESNHDTTTNTTTTTTTTNTKNSSSSSSTNNNNRTALLEQFMVSTNTFISMGGNSDGTCGLRINEDLTKGESSTAIGFDNEPLHQFDYDQQNHHHRHDGKGSVFEIGLVEVYGFVRQMDGKTAS